MLRRFRVLLHITRSHLIARRYFVVNGFDGALTMLGLVVGFAVSEPVGLPVVITACVGAAVALGVSGMTSAWLSETAEKQSELRELERAMITDLGESAYGHAARVLPIAIALVNGSAPLVISILIIAPLWAAQGGVSLPLPPLHTSLAMALAMIFLLGVYLGRISGTFWLWAGIRTLLIAMATALLIFLIRLR